jgi:hypothetical protein
MVAMPQNGLAIPPSLATRSRCEFLYPTEIVNKKEECFRDINLSQNIETSACDPETGFLFRLAGKT